MGFLLITLLIPASFIHTSSSAQQEAVVYVCPMHPEVQSSKPGNCPRCEMKLVAKQDIKKEEKPAAPAPDTYADGFTCPMHPDVRSDKPGNCPKCEMKLVAVIPAIGEDFDLRFEAIPPAPKPNEKVTLRFSVYNPRTGQRVKDFQLLHERFYHVFVVSQDMREFQHIHPRQESDGAFTVETQLPIAGSYKVYSDFYPNEGVPQVIQHNLSTAGAANDLFSAQPRLAPDAALVKAVEAVKVAPEEAFKVGVDPDVLHTQTVGGMKIELKTEPQDIIAGKPVRLLYHLTDAKTGEAVRDLLPLLGAWGHTLILSQDQTDYVHSHPEEQVPTGEERARARGGPDVTFEALMPRPGIYRIWTQFLRGGALATVTFTIKVSRLQ
ncbi:MAG: heavy metal-binding domain-containing protein [Acidobacteriota bacterium]